MVRFYADEQFPFQVVEFLRGFGYDVLTVQEAGNANQRIPDDQVLMFAISQERAILTISDRSSPPINAIAYCLKSNSDLLFITQNSIA